MPTHIYHWKHGWIPLDHMAALSKAKGSHAAAVRYLDQSHAAGHAHATVVHGSYGGGTHVRGLQPVSREHLPREGHITAAFNPDSHRFAIHDQKGAQRLDGTHTGESLSTAIPEHLAAHLHQKGHTIIGVRAPTSGDRVLVRTKTGDLKSFAANGSDINQVDPEHVDAPPPPSSKHPAPAGDGPGAYVASHTVDTRSMGSREYGVIKPVSGFGGVDVINIKLARRINDDPEGKVIGYERKVVTFVGSDGVVRRFKADGSNVYNPVIAKPAAVKAVKDIGEWKALPVNEAIPTTTTGKPISTHKVQRAYRQGNKTVLIESKVTEAEAEAFLGHVKQAFDAAGDATAHAVTVHVPSGENHFRAKRGGTILGFVYDGDSTRVHINPSVVKDSADPNHFRPGDHGHFMAAHVGVHPSVYTITHELGHIVDNHQQHTKTPNGRTPSGIPIPLGYKDSAAAVHHEHRANLSTYGRKNVAEGYAEAFAHHHLKERGSNPNSVPDEGSTANDRAAAAYAERFAWKAAPGGISKASDSVIRIAARGGDQSAIREARRRGIPV